MPSKSKKDFGSGACLECGSIIIFRIARDLVRKKYCCRACRSRDIGRRKDMRPLWAKANTPEANRKKGLPGESHPNWKPFGSKQVRYDGYVKIKTAYGWPYEHRIIAKALPGQHVHHIDRDTGNNSEENLVLLSPSEHASLHLMERRNAVKK